MSRGVKRYSTTYKKKVDVERDIYLPRRSPKGLLSCRDCGTFYYRRRWTLSVPEDVRKLFASGKDAHVTVCPACRKTREGYPYGEVRLFRVPDEERQECLRLLKNEEQRAREKNPLERIMGIRAEGPGWNVETTTEKLAQRLGHRLKKARGGEVSYHWSHNNKFVRVVWTKEWHRPAASDKAKAPAR